MSLIMVYNITQIYRKVRHTISHECGHNPYSLKFRFFFPKLFWDFQKWTKKMSKINFPKKVSEKTDFVTIMKN